jgi:hypothetical protein
MEETAAAGLGRWRSMEWGLEVAAVGEAMVEMGERVLGDLDSVTGCRPVMP